MIPKGICIYWRGLKMFKGILYFAWIGFSLTALFFYPLASSLSDGLYYMQWKVYNTYELFACMILGMIIFGFVFSCVEKVSNKYISSIAIIVLSIVPLSSFIIHLCRQLELSEYLLRLYDISIMGLNLSVVFSMFLLLAAIVLLTLFKDKVGKIVLSVILIISPVSIVVATTVCQYGFNDTLNEISIKIQKNDLNETTLPNIFVFVFDELDYNYIYQNETIKPKYPNLFSYSNSAINYHDAISPGKHTLTSLPGLLLGVRNNSIEVCRDYLCQKNSNGSYEKIKYSDHNIFKSAQSIGYKTAIYGWMHSYCEQFNKYLDECRSYSLYNYSSVNNKFSLLNPILTNIILWPRQFPFGLVKNPIISIFQKLTVNQTYAKIFDKLSYEPPLFMVAHFSVPHSPFVFDENGFNPALDPFLQNRDNYEKQISYIDNIFGNFYKNVSGLNNYKIMLTSDHGYREFLKQEDWDKVPLIVWDSESERKKDVFYEVKTEEILFSLLDEAAIKIF